MKLHGCDVSETEHVAVEQSGPAFMYKVTAGQKKSP